MVAAALPARGRIPRRQRARIEATIEFAQKELDRIDGDPDLEDDDLLEDGGDDEPWLGAANPDAGTIMCEGFGGEPVEADGLDQRRWSSGRDDDRERDDAL